MTAAENRRRLAFARAKATTKNEKRGRGIREPTAGYRKLEGRRR